MSSISPELQRKESFLQEVLRGAGPLLVAFSGGADSSYLAWAAHRALAEGALAVTALAGIYPIWRMNRLDAVRAVRTG